MILRTGKIRSSVCDRSVVKRLGSLLEPDSQTISAEPFSTPAERAGMLSVQSAVNRLAADGIRARRIRTVLLLPEGTEEQQLRDIEDDIARTADRLELKITGGHTEVTSAVTRPVVITSAEGEPFAGSTFHRKKQGKATAGMKLVMTGYAGAEGTYLLAAGKPGKLSGRFSGKFTERALALGEHLSALRHAQVLYKSVQNPEQLLVQHASEGGIYAALWHISARAGMGFDVSVPGIPIRQETIEIADFFDIDPYQTASEGCLLAAVPNKDTDTVLEALGNAGIHAQVIGSLTAGNGKCLHNEEEVRFLDMPQADPLIAALTVSGETSEYKLQ